MNTIYTHIINYLKSIFYLDLRALAIFRIIIGILIIADLIQRSQYLTMHYTDYGIMPRHLLLLTHWPYYNFSLHLISGEFFFQAILFITAGVFALLFSLGYRTKLSAIISWVLIFSLQLRNPLILNGGDQLLKLFLFWSIFLPIERKYSIDNLNNQYHEKSNKHFSIASIAFICQLSFMYIAASLEKTGLPWKDGSALYYALNIDYHATYLGKYIITLPPYILTFVTKYTLYLELLGCSLLLIPFKNKVFRLLTMGSFIGLHQGFQMFLRVGFFSLVAITIWLTLMPSTIIDLVEGSSTFQRIKKNIEQFFQSLIGQYKWLQHKKSDIKHIHQPYQLYKNILVGILFIAVTLLNFKKDFLPKSILDLAGYLQLHQKWAMFAPAPATGDGWNVIIGKQHDGTEVDLFNNGKPIDWHKPQLSFFHKKYPDLRIRKQMWGIRGAEYEKYRQTYLEYLLKDWNGEYNNTNKQIKKISLYFIEEITQPNYTDPKMVKVLLYEGKVENNKLIQTLDQPVFFPLDSLKESSN